jgi:hypothetical protein
MKSRSALAGSVVLDELFRYLLVGGIAFSADFCSLYLLTKAGLHYLASACVAFLKLFHEHQVGVLNPAIRELESGMSHLFGFSSPSASLPSMFCFGILG